MRDESLLDSALARPQHTDFYGDPAPDLADLATSMAFGLARNHPFVDGNKRTAHVCYRVFLELNGVDLVVNDLDKYITMIALVEGSLPEGEFATWLRDHIKLDAEKQVNEPHAVYAR